MWKTVKKMEKKRIVLLIDSLCSGGAQRQLCFLAKLLEGSGYMVTIVTYYDDKFLFATIKNTTNVHFRCVNSRGQLDRFRKINKELKRLKPDVVIAFLGIPSIIAILLRIWSLFKFKVIVSERNTDSGVPNVMSWFRLMLYMFSAKVVSNSYAQLYYLRRYAPWLRTKLCVISNCVNLPEHVTNLEKGDDCLELIVLARYEHQKNGLALVRALSAYYRDSVNRPVKISWYGGNPHPKNGIKQSMQNEIIKNDLGDSFKLFEPIENVGDTLKHADALCLCSLHEGCANVIGEAMSHGLPCIVTDVGDNSYLVRNGVDGLVLNGLDSESILLGLKKFAALAVTERSNMSKSSRARAIELLSQKRFLKEWDAIILEA